MKLKRSGHVKVEEVSKFLRDAFRELGLPLIYAETGIIVSARGGLKAYVECWAMLKDLAAAETLARIMEESEK